MSTARRMTVIGLFAVVGGATPLVAHAIGGSCWIYLPAHVPALLAGLALGPLAGVVTGLATSASDLIWGGRVHGIAFLPLGFEFTAYGAVGGLLSGWADRYPRRLAALVTAMVGGRLAHLAVALALAWEPPRLLRGLFVVPWPGILLHLVMLPVLVPPIRRLTAGRRSALTVRPV